MTRMAVNGQLKKTVHNMYNDETVGNGTGHYIMSNKTERTYTLLLYTDIHPNYSTVCVCQIESDKVTNHLPLTKLGKLTPF